MTDGIVYEWSTADGQVRRFVLVRPDGQHVEIDIKSSEGWIELGESNEVEGEDY